MRKAIAATAAATAVAAALFLGGILAPAPVEAACAYQPEMPKTIYYYSDATLSAEVGRYTEYCCSGTTQRTGTITQYSRVRQFESCPSTASPYTDTCYVSGVVVACP